VYVGITGGIGSGKTTVADLIHDNFSDDGAVVIHADELAHQALGVGSPLIPEVARAFGENLVNDEGVLNRRALGNIVFASPSKLKVLESLVHPEVARLAREARSEAPAGSIVFYDVPLLVEKNMHEQFDQVLVVESPMDLRRERLIRRGLTLDEIDARVAAQATDLERRAIADFVIVNDAGLDRLADQVSNVWTALSA
jgi:dephospho-CoA kinase